MPEIDNGDGSQMHLRDILALLFAALCGLLLGIAAAPVVLPKLGFAFAQYVQPRVVARAGPSIAGQSKASETHPQAVASRPQPVVSHQPSAANHPQTVSNVPIHRNPQARAHQSLAMAKAISRRRSAGRGASALGSENGMLATMPLPWFELWSLFGLALLALLSMAWLRRDLFASILCRLAKDPRVWRKQPSAGVVNARCVLYFEGNAYRLGAEFFSQSVEVRYTPLFVRVNMRGSDRAIILPRRVPRVSPGRALKRRGASNQMPAEPDAASMHG